jgi:tetratricopeptide (TPR) repeat protein
MAVPVIPRLHFTKAKSEEVNGIKGEWNRVVLKVVEREFPELLPAYRQQALTELTKAVEQSGRSAQTVASLGLLLAQTGDKGEAMHLLEEALRKGAERPKVRIELARLRLANYLQAKTAPDPKLTESEVADILSLLSEFLKNPRPLYAAYDLARQVFQHVDRAPNPAESRLLAEGKLRFGP